jgi:signal transduction histidine kinase
MGRDRSYLAELVRINDTLIWSHDRTDSLVAAVEILREITGARIAPTYLLSAAGDLLVLVADAETQQAVGASYATMPAHEHVRDPWVNVEEWPVSAADHQDSDGWLSLPEDFRAWFGPAGVVVSIHADGRHLGATLLCFDGPWRLTRQRKEFLAAAGRILGNAVYRWQVGGRERELGTLEERRRLGDELHVDLSQQVAALGLHVEVLRLDADAGDLDRLRGGLAALDALTVDLNRSLRHQMLGLRTDAELVQGSFVDQVRRHLRTFERQFAIPVTLECPDEPAVDAVPLALAAQLVRVLQEALANVHLHAHAGSVVVRLDATRTRIRMEVADDGNGFDPTSVPDSRLGVRIMSERMQQVDGAVRIRPEAGAGTCVVAEAPLHPGCCPQTLPEEVRR